MLSIHLHIINNKFNMNVSKLKNEGILQINCHAKNCLKRKVLRDVLSKFKEVLSLISIGFARTKSNNSNYKGEQ